jgi:hypothetical protein
MQFRTLSVLVAFLSVSAGCVVEEEPVVGEETIELRDPSGPLLVQPGSRLLLLEVTDDNYAIYQEGQSVYATALRASAPRQHIADVPGGNFAFVYRVGKVAFVWTDPDRSLPGFGVSPLVIWSAASGAHLAAAASPIGTLATAASRNGEYVLFPSNGTPDGAIGDLEFATTDLATRSTLVAGVQMSFPVGPCRPLATFVGDDPIAAYCPEGATVAQVSRWQDGERCDLVAEAATPPVLSIDPRGERLLTLLAGSRNPVTIDLQHPGPVELVAAVSASSSFLGVDRAAFYTTRTNAGAELFRTRRQVATKILELRGFLAFTFGSRSLMQPPTSDDGQSILSFGSFDPNTGLVDVRLSRTRGDRSMVTLEPQPVATLAGPPFTADSARAIYARITDLSTFFADLVVADAQTRQVYSTDVWSWNVGARGIVSFNERAVFNPADPFFATADLSVVDTAQGQAQLIAPQAYVSYFPSHRGTRVVYATGQGSAPPGLYVARVERAW